MGTPPRGSLLLAIRRALISVAVFAQVLLVFAPLLEVREDDTAARGIISAVTNHGDAAWVSAHERPAPHNPTTCPACIAQSLHARLESGVRLPTVVVVDRALADRRTTLVPHHDPPSTHHSRAPPVVS